MQRRNESNKKCHPAVRKDEEEYVNNIYQNRSYKTQPPSIQVNAAKHDKKEEYRSRCRPLKA